MLRAKYKLRTGDNAQLYLRPHELKESDFLTVDYLKACEHKGLKPILKTPARRIRHLKSIYSYPSLNEVAAKAKCSIDALLTEEASISSKSLTKWYVEQFYMLNCTFESPKHRDVNRLKPCKY